MTIPHLFNWSQYGTLGLAERAILSMLDQEAFINTPMKPDTSFLAPWNDVVHKEKVDKEKVKKYTYS